VSGRPRPVLPWLLVAVLGQLSARALAGGVALVVAPSGAIVGLPTAPLEGTPFADFLVPGVVLVVAFGLVPAAVCYAVYAARAWAWTGAVGVGVALVAWVAVELAVGFDRPTVYLNLATAVAAVLLALHPSVRRRGAAM
jgi:hypothetical protein